MSEISLLGPSKTKILRLIQPEGKTAVSVAANLHVQVSAVRKHFEQLATLGLVESSFEKGEIGRPKKIHTLTEKGRELFPRTYDTLLEKIIVKLVDRDGPDKAESLLTSIAKDVASPIDGHGARD